MLSSKRFGALSPIVSVQTAALLVPARKYERLAVETPGLRRVLRSGFRPGKPLGDTTAVGTLVKDPPVSFSIGLKGDGLAVRRPNRIQVSTGKGQSARWTGGLEVDDPDVGVLAIVGRHRQLIAPRRYARMPGRLLRKRKRFDLAVQLGKRERVQNPRRSADARR